MKWLLTCTFSLFIYCALAQVSFNADSIGRWQDSNLPENGLSNTYNEVWGFTWKDGEYGVIGSRSGTYIINVTDPADAKLVNYIPGVHNDATNRDYHDFNGYLYMVCDQGNSTLQIADLSYLPDSVHVIYDSRDLFVNCHNIFIDSTSGRLYACDVKDTAKRDIDLEIYDISLSPIPQKLLTYDQENIEAFHDIYVRRDTVFGNRGNSGLYIYDFTDIGNPQLISSITDYADKGFNHAGYASEKGPYYYFTDETKGKDIKVVEFENIFDPQVIGLFNAGRNKQDIVAHNVLVNGDFLYVSYYHEGLQVYSIVNPAKPQPIAFYQTYNKNITDVASGKKVKDYSGYRGAWGVYPFLPSGNILLSDRDKGLFIFRLWPSRGPLQHKLAYPNPFSNIVDIAYKFQEVQAIDLFDLNGKLIEKDLGFTNYKGIPRVTVVNDLSQGIYLMRVKARYEVFTVKVAKE